MADINRIKVILVEKKKTNKWLADRIGKDQATVSKWCTNTTQPTLDTLVEIARILEVDVRELLVPTDTQKIMMTVLYSFIRNAYYTFYILCFFAEYAVH